jgi:exosortase/archaeosortase family protein
MSHLKFVGRLKKETRLFTTFAFLIKLLLLSIPLYIIISFNLDLSLLQVAAASQSNFILGLMGLDVIQDGAVLSVGDVAGEPFTFIISRDSTGWKSMLFLFALIFSVPAVRFRRRIIGLLAGEPLIWLGNLGRVTAIVLAERSYGFQTAMIVHDWLWRFGLIALVLGIWLVWWKVSR